MTKVTHPKPSAERIECTLRPSIPVCTPSLFSPELNVTRSIWRNTVNRNEKRAALGGVTRVEDPFA